MRKYTTQSGFSAIEIIIVVAVVAIIGYLGYTFYNNSTNKAVNESSTTTQDEYTAPEITTDSDLDNAAAVMDETQLDSANEDDLSELDGAMADL